MIRRPPAPLPWLAALLALYLLGPFLAGIPQVWAADWGAVDGAALGRACAVSVASATLATAFIALGGIPLGYLLARVPGRAMGALGFLVQLPLALPPLASGVLLLFLLGRRGLVGRLAGGGLTDSFVGIVLAETFVAAPFLIIAARSAFASIDPALEGVAATLGHGRTATFLKVSLPLAWPAMRAGLLLAWLRGFGEFGATVMVAYHPYSLPVYTYVAFGSQGLPVMLPVLLPALAAALFVMGLSSVNARPIRIRREAATIPQAGGSVQLRAAHHPGGARSESAPSTDLAFQFRKKLDGFGLDISWSTRARRLAILGPSGSGKSLTLRLIAGLEQPDTGKLAIGERDLSHLPPEGRSIAYVPQNYGLFPHQTIAEHLRFPIGADPDKAQHWLERLSLSGLTHRLPAALSLGQQQRVALARALVRPAELLLLDEPFSALDAPLRRRLRHELRDLQREIAATTIIVTHDPEEAALLADELLIIEDGRVLQAGSVAEIFRRPASETVARLLGAEPVGEGIAIAENRIEIGGGVTLIVAGPPLRAGQHVGWSIRPERVRLGREGQYSVAIESNTLIGNSRIILVRLGAALLSVLAGPADGEVEGSCRLDIDPSSIQVWAIARASAPHSA